MIFSIYYENLMLDTFLLVLLEIKFFSLVIFIFPFIFILVYKIHFCKFHVYIKLRNEIGWKT